MSNMKENKVGDYVEVKDNLEIGKIKEIEKLDIDKLRDETMFGERACWYATASKNASKNPVTCPAKK